MNQTIRPEWVNDLDIHKNDYLHFEEFYEDDGFTIRPECYCTACYFARVHKIDPSKINDAIVDLLPDEVKRFYRRYRELGFDR